MNEKLYKYLQIEWRWNNHPRYQHYFKEWVDNLTDTQILYYKKLWLKDETP